MAGREGSCLPIHTWGPPGSNVGGLRPVEGGEPRGTSGHKRWFGATLALALCHPHLLGAEDGVGQTCCLIGSGRVAGTWSLSRGVRGGRRKRSSRFHQASGVLYLPDQRPSEEPPGFSAEQPDPATKCLLHARLGALPGRMAVWEELEGCVLWWLSPIGEDKAETSLLIWASSVPYQPRTSNDSVNAKRPHTIHC